MRRHQLPWAETPTAAENREPPVWESGEQLFLLTNLLLDPLKISRDPPTCKAEFNKLTAAKKAFWQEGDAEICLRENTQSKLEKKLQTNSMLS